MGGPVNHHRHRLPSQAWGSLRNQAQNQLAACPVPSRAMPSTTRQPGISTAVFQRVDGEHTLRRFSSLSNEQ